MLLAKEINTFRKHPFPERSTGIFLRNRSTWLSGVEYEKRCQTPFLPVPFSSQIDVIMARSCLSEPHGGEVGGLTAKIDWTSHKTP